VHEEVVRTRVNPEYSRGAAYTGSYAAENEDGVVEVELEDELEVLEVRQVRGAERQVEENTARRKTKKTQRRREGRKRLKDGRQKRKRQVEEGATPSTPTRAARSLQPQMGTPVQAGSVAITRQGAHTPLRHARLQGPRAATPIPYVAHPTLVVNVTMAGMQRQYRMPSNTVGGLCRAVHQATEGETGTGELQVWRTYGDQQPLNKSRLLFKAGVQDGDCLTMAYVAYATGAEESAAAVAAPPMAPPRPRAPAGAAPLEEWQPAEGLDSAVMVRFMTEVQAFKYGELGTCEAPQETLEQLIFGAWRRDDFPSQWIICLFPHRYNPIPHDAES
jgi:hypothetical protein